MRVLEAGESGFGKDHGLLELLLHQLYLLEHGIGRKIVRQRVIIVHPDVIESIPKANAFELRALGRAIDQRSLVQLAGPRDQLAPLGLEARHLYELDADPKYVGMHAGRQVGVEFEKLVIILEPDGAIFGAGEVNVAGKGPASPELRLQHHFDAALMGQHGDGLDELRLLPPAAETDRRIRPAAESVGYQRDSVHTVALQAIEYRNRHLRRVSYRTLGGEVDSLLEEYLGFEEVGKQDAA